MYTQNVFKSETFSFAVVVSGVWDRSDDTPMKKELRINVRFLKFTVRY